MSGPAGDGGGLQRLRAFVAELRAEHEEREGKKSGKLTDLEVKEVLTKIAELRERLDWLNRELELMECSECGAIDDRRRGWTMRLDVDDELVIFCPDCDEREFGGG
jgi:hypothetical protein